MTFQRKPETTPQPSQLLGGAGAILVFNVVLLLGGMAFLVIRDYPGAYEPLAWPVAMLVLFHGLWQWLYVLPLSLLGSTHRGTTLGVLLGAAVYTLSHACCMMLLFYIPVISMS